MTSPSEWTSVDAGLPPEYRTGTAPYDPVWCWVIAVDPEHPSKRRVVQAVLVNAKKNRWKMAWEDYQFYFEHVTHWRRVVPPDLPEEATP